MQIVLGPPLYHIWITSREALSRYVSDQEGFSVCATEMNRRGRKGVDHSKDEIIELVGRDSVIISHHARVRMY